MMRVRFPCGWPSELVLFRMGFYPPGRGLGLCGCWTYLNYQLES